MQKSVIKEETLISRIYFIRGEKVMLDFDLALLYGVETKRLKEAVRRNIKRFPNDFMFEISYDEYRSLRTQFATLKRGTHSKYSPFAFTEQGVAMLSSVLNSESAIEVNIAIMRTFVQLRKLMSVHKDLADKIEMLEKKYDGKFEEVFKLIGELLVEEVKTKRRIGF